MKDKKPIVGITCGDLNGIGTEVTINALNDNRILKYMTPVILSTSKVISFYKKQMNLEAFNFYQVDDIGKINPKKANVLNVWKDHVEVVPGEPSKTLGKFTKLSLQRGVELLKSQQIDALVTAPLNKDLVQGDGFDFPGHTEYLASAFEQQDSLMFMVHEELRVGVVTGHIPLAQVNTSITRERIMSKARIMLKSLKEDFGKRKPRVAVLGLNPHAGEGGLLGREEIEVIEPAIQELKREGHLVSGPFPADGFFGSGMGTKYDAVLAMYHDQGLIPFKQYAFGGGVNYTAGLPAIRTSPDHGTAFNLAGKNVADASSMRSALFCACDIFRQRREMSEA
ncbi:MAG: 4-hydroxythreonine-4-phosphate dehydrogenase PdxA [Bacteroidota bacterium]